MTTRKHFVATADIINESISEGLIDTDTAEALAKRFSHMFKADNPRFDRERFIRACTANAAE
jgi:hypothetical protein